MVAQDNLSKRPSQGTPVAATAAEGDADVVDGVVGGVVDVVDDETAFGVSRPTNWGLPEWQHGCQLAFCHPRCLTPVTPTGLGVAAVMMQESSVSSSRWFRRLVVVSLFGSRAHQFVAETQSHSFNRLQRLR